MDEMSRVKRKASRRYSEEFKAQVLADCENPGAVILEVAQKHGVAISLVHKWRYTARLRAGTQTPRASPPSPSVGDFVALPVVAKATAAALARSLATDTGMIRIDMHGATTSVCVHWPLAASEQCSVWLRALLR